MPNPIVQITVEQLKEKIDRKETFKLIDCREKEEYATCHIDGSTLIPLSEFATMAMKELNPEDDIVIHCHHGGRSQRACEFLFANGFKKLSNVAGGIDAWSIKIDPKVSRY